jgi:hypothetical protein
VPLGETYVELVAVVDEAKAATSTFGRWVAGGAAPAGRPLGWAVRTSELDAVAERLGLAVTAGSRMSPGGEIRWRTAGLERAETEPPLPFFIEWSPVSPLPGAATIAHPAGSVAIARLVLEGDTDRLAAWLGDHVLPIVCRPGAGALTSVVISGPTGEVVLGEEG